MLSVRFYVPIDKYNENTVSSLLYVDVNTKALLGLLFTFRFQLVESIPENLTYNSGPPIHPSTFTGIKQLIGLAQETIEIASFYWTMRSEDLPVQDESAWQVVTLMS